MNALTFLDVVEGDSKLSRNHSMSNLQQGTLNRRGLLLGLASALAAPAIVHAGNLMPIRSVPRLLRPKELFQMINSIILKRPPSCHWEWHDIPAEDFYVRQ